MMMRPVLPSARRGFSFVELLFAIAVLGIGFIMIAAIFPVGLQQTKLSLDETAAAANARTAVASMQQLGASTSLYVNGGTVTGVMPRSDLHSLPTLPNAWTYRGVVRTLNDRRNYGPGIASDENRRKAVWNAVASDSISPAQTRNATALMYKRDVYGVSNNGTLETRLNSYSQIVAINAQIANAAEYRLPSKQLPIYDFEPRPVAVQIVYDPKNQNYVASFFSVKDLDGPGANPRGGYPNGTVVLDGVSYRWDDVLDAAVGAVTEGAFVVISDDRIRSDNPPLTNPLNRLAGTFNGRVFKLGGRRVDLETGNGPDDPVTYDLAPGYGFTPEAGPDGLLNSRGSASNDDLIAIGIDRTAQLKNTVTYDNGARKEMPLGSNTPNGERVEIFGSNNNKGAVALVLGRGFRDPELTPQSRNDYVGPAQDVSLYTTFVTAKDPQ